MRSTFVSCVCAVGCLAGAASAQPPEIPSRLSLAEAVTLAIAYNPALQAARQQAAAAETDVAAARRRPNPVASIGSEGFNGSPAGVGFFDKQELTVRVEQELELAGRRALRSRAAAASSAGARALADDQGRQLRLDVRQAYFQLVLARLDAGLAAASLAEVDKVIDLNRARYRQGEVSGGELRRLEVERLKFSDDALQAELASRNARALLLALLGAARLDVPVEPTDGLAPVPGAGGGPARPDGAPEASRLTAQALAARPDVAAARQEQARADAELGLQRAFRTPNLFVTGGYKRDVGSNGVVWGVTIPVPLFDRNAPGRARAQAERSLAGTRLRAQELVASLDVQRAVNLVDISRERLALLERDYLSKAREARDSVLAAYRAGEGSLLDYLDAQRAYRDVQRTYNRALLDYRLSLFQLDAAVGGPTGDVQP
jgi:outer membrane protein, heavy metal efflux system